MPPLDEGCEPANLVRGLEFAMASLGAEGPPFSAVHSCKCSDPSSAEHPVIDHVSCVLVVAELDDGSTHETRPGGLDSPRVQKDSAGFTRWVRYFCKGNVYVVVRGLHPLKYQCTDAFSTVTKNSASDSTRVAHIQVRGIRCDPDFDMALLNFHKKLLPSHSLWDIDIDIHFAECLIPLIDRAFIVNVRVPFRGS